MATTTNLGITLLEQSQAQKEVTINQALNCLDALISSSVADKDLAAPPSSPVTGVAYIVAASPTGAWAGKANAITYFDQIWRFVTPTTNMRIFVRDESQYYQFNGTAWIVVSSSGDMTQSMYDPANIDEQLVGVSAAQTLTNKTLNNTTRLGIGTTDAGNVLSVVGNTVLFASATGDVRATLNKTAAVNNALFAFQNGFSTRAEFGLAGNDDFTVKVSADGTSFNNGLVIDRTSGAVSLPNTTSLAVNAATATKLATARLINGVSFDGSADITISAAANASALTGTTLASGVVNSSLTTVGTITSGVWQGTAIADARIASAATWNAKQNALTLTTTGTSGAATLVGSTLNIPQYSGGGGGAVSSVFTRTGAVVAQSGDYDTSQVTENTNLYFTNARAFSAAFPLGLFGDGSDGNVTISSGTTTLTRDMYYATLTINGTGILNTAGFKVYCQTALDISAAQQGAIINNGGNGGSGATAGTAGTAATAAGVGSTSINGSSNAGGAGGTTTGTAAASGGTASTFTGGVVAGGAGGLGSSGAGGNGSAAAATITVGASFRRYISDFVRIAQGSINAYATSRLSSGGGGGGDGTAGGGGGSGGASGGVVAIYARTIERGTNTNTSILQARGGNGGNGGSAIAGNRGGGGGGVGGPGGMIYICHAGLAGSSIADALDVSGGPGGNGGNGFGTGVGGGGGGRGGRGRIAVINILTGLGTESAPDNGAAGTAASGNTGGIGAAQVLARASL